MGNKSFWLGLALLCIGCGGASQSAPPKEPSSETTPESTTEAAPSKKSEAGDAAGESKGSSEPNQAPTSDKAGGKKSCSGLDKSTCKVTMGCVWNDVKKCVEQAADDQ